MTVMTTKIRKMLAEGATTKEIVAKLKCKPQNVYQVRYWDKKKSYKLKTKTSTLMQRIKQFFRRK